MNKRILNFLKTRLDLIANNEFTKLYKEAEELEEAYPLTEVLQLSGINPLVHMKQVPDYYMATAENIDHLVIPKNIIAIGTSSFWSSSVQTVDFPEGLLDIGESSFSECRNLKHINLPASVEYIRTDAFADSGLEEIIFPDLLHRVSMMCCQDCKQLKSVKLGRSTVEVGQRAFDGCEELEYVDLQNVEIIKDFAFSDCDKLTKIELPDTLTTIYDRAFFGTPDVRIICSAGSVGHKFAITNGFKFDLK